MLAILDLEEQPVGILHQPLLPLSATKEATLHGEVDMSSHTAGYAFERRSHC